jgi:hypothetical protein
VNEQATKAVPGSSWKGLIGACALLFGFLLPAGLAISWVVARRFDALVLQAGLIAIGLCWLAGALALLATHVSTRARAPVHGVLLGMLLRMGLPLIAGLALNQVAPLAEVGIFSMILGVYLCALIAETLLSLRMVQSAPQVSAAPQQAGIASGNT